MFQFLWVKERIEILIDMTESLKRQSLVQGNNVTRSDGFSFSLVFGARSTFQVKEFQTSQALSLSSAPQSKAM